MKGGLSVVKVSDGKLKFAGKIDSRTRKALGDKAADKIAGLIKKGTPLNSTALKALLTHKSALAKKLSDFAAKRAGSAGTKMSVKDDKVAYSGNKNATIKVSPSAVFGNKSNPYINITQVDVNKNKGVMATKDLIDDLAEKLGVPKNAKSNVTVRVAENRNEEKESGITSKYVGATFMPRNKIITINKGLVNDIVKNKGKEAAGVLIHEMGHFIVGEKRANEGTTLAHGGRRGLTPAEIAEEIGVELLAQSMSDSRNRIGYEAIIAQGTKAVATMMNIPMKDAAEKIINVGLAQNASEDDTKRVLTGLSMMKTLGRMSAVETVKARDEVLDAAVEIFEKKGFDVVKDRQNAQKVTEDSLLTARVSAADTRWSAVNTARPDVVMVYAASGGLPMKFDSKKLEAEAKLATVHVLTNRMNAADILVNQNLPQELKTRLAEMSLFNQTIRDVAVKGKTPQELIADNQQTVYNRLLSNEQIAKVVNTASSKEFIARYNVASLTALTTAETVFKAPDANARTLAYALKMAGSTGIDMGTGMTKDIEKNADLIYAARTGDASALAKVKEVLPKQFQQINKNIAENAEKVKFVEQVSQNDAAKKELDRALGGMVYLARMNAEHPRKVSMKVVETRIRDTVSALERAMIAATGNPESGKRLNDVLRDAFSNVSNMAKNVTAKGKPATPASWSVPNAGKPTPTPKVEPPKVESPKVEKPKATSKPRTSKKTEFSIGQQHKDMLTNIMMKTQMGQSTSSLKESKPDTYKELEDNGFVKDGKLTDKGRNYFIKK